jgi:hypothetical protein
MNNIVYLFDLDSYRSTSNTDGFYALFEEIVHHGNCVAISMNQLTDSSFFAEAIKDADTYPLLLQLFEVGALRISRYGAFRTASQYVQSAINDCIQNGKDAFIFSNMPIRGDDPEQLMVILDALQYSDVTRITEELSDRGDLDLDLICRFVNIILKLSAMKSETLPLKSPAGRTFEEFLSTALSLLGKRSFADRNLDKEIKKAVRSLMEKSEQITVKRNTRSAWLNAYKGEEDRYPLAITIINCCYNYTIQDSISGVCKSYDDQNFEASFQADLIKRIKKEYRKSNNNYKQTVRKQLWRWKMLIRFAEYRQKDNLVIGGVYSKTAFTTQLFWKMRLLIRVILSFGWTIFYSTLFFATEWFTGLLENLYANYSSTSGNSGFAETFFSIFIFGLFGSFVSIIYKKITNGQDMPDLIKCITGMLEKMLDCGYILFGGLYDEIRMLG